MQSERQPDRRPEDAFPSEGQVAFAGKRTEEFMPGGCPGRDAQDVLWAGGHRQWGRESVEMARTQVLTFII